MDQTPSKSTDHRQIDQNNNNSSTSSDKSNQNKDSACSCTNISIMQLFHEMKQECPKVPDHIVQQLVTENCHNRRACLEQLQKVVSSTIATPTMYPSKSIHSSSNNLNNNNDNRQTPRSPINGMKRGSVSSQKMKEISERFENTSISNSSSSEASTSNDSKIKRPTTLPLRRAPDPPTNASNRSPSTTPSSTTSVSSFSTSTTSQLQQTIEQPHQQQQQQMHHNVVLDSTASKINDSLNLQLNVKVSPVSAKRPAPPPPPVKNRPQANQRYTSHLSVHPEPPYSSMIDSRNNNLPLNGAVACTGTSGQRSYTNVKLTLRQPSASQTPINIQAGPSTLSYSSSSFNAQQGCESHLKITVAGNGESCIQAVRTAKNATDINQIDTTINIEGNYMMNDNVNNSQYRIISNPYIPQQHYQQQIALPQNNRLTEDELRQLIKRQMKQKESLECELEKEREKLQMIRLDIITLTSPVMTQCDLKELCDEITRLRTVCERLSDEIDVATTPQRSPRAIINSYSPSNCPPIPRGLVSRKGHSPSNSLLPQLDTTRLNYPATDPPTYNEVMRGTERNQPMDSNLADDKWTCSICTYSNHMLLNMCEACEMPKVQGITITASSFRPLQHNHLQRASVPSNQSDNNSNNSSNVIQATAL